MEDKQGESMVASYKYLGVSNPGLQMLGSNECDVSYNYGTRSCHGDKKISFKKIAIELMYWITENVQFLRLFAQYHVILHAKMSMPLKALFDHVWIEY